MYYMLYITYCNLQFMNNICILYNISYMLRTDVRPLIVNIRINILQYERDRVSLFTENQKIRRLSQSIESL